MIDLTAKVAVVTGAGSGIGAETARVLARCGAKVVVSGRGQGALDTVVAGIRDAGGDALAIVAEMESEADIAALVEGTMAEYGRVDVFHANAALTDVATQSADLGVLTMDPEVWDRTMAVNLRGPMLCVKHAVPHMIAGGGGSIIFSSSGRGLQGDYTQTAYGASKAALNMLSRYVAAQFGKQNIRSNTLVIGLVMTEGLKENLPEAVRTMLQEHHLTPDIGKPKDIANAVAFLASDLSSFITGSEIPVDGGFVSHAPQYADIGRYMASMEQGQR